MCKGVNEEVGRRIWAREKGQIDKTKDTWKSRMETYYLFNKLIKNYNLKNKGTLHERIMLLPEKMGY